MSRKMVFKVMMSAFWRKSCDPQRPPPLDPKDPVPAYRVFTKIYCDAVPDRIDLGDSMGVC